MRKISFVLIIIMLFSLIGCSTETNTSNINVDVNDLKFKKDIGAELSSDFAINYLTVVGGSIVWYNIFIQDNTIDRSDIVDDIAKISTEDFIDMATNNKLNKKEKDMANESLDLTRMIAVIGLNNAKIKKEETLRDKNIGELSEEEYNKKISEQADRIEELKSYIENVLELYFE